MRLSSVRSWFIGLLLLATSLILSDHLTSPTSPALASQSGGGSCAPCGAPCELTK